MYGAILGDLISQQYKFDNSGIFYLVDRKFKFRVNNIKDEDGFDNVREGSDDSKCIIKTSATDENKPSFDYSKGKVIKTSEEAKEKVREFERGFANKADFYQALKDFGFKWRGENSSDDKIISMWARYALARAIDDGFDPFKK